MNHLQLYLLFAYFNGPDLEDMDNSESGDEIEFEGHFIVQTLTEDTVPLVESESGVWCVLSVSNLHRSAQL